MVAVRQAVLCKREGLQEGWQLVQVDKGHHLEQEQDQGDVHYPEWEAGHLDPKGRYTKCDDTGYTNGRWSNCTLPASTTSERLNRMSTAS